MKGELRYANNPNKMRLFWAIFYTTIFAVIIVGLYAIGNRIRTNSLPTGQIQLSVPYSKYLVGEVITFTVHNNFNSPIYITNQCPAEPLNVYRQENGTWQRLHDNADLKDCKNESRQIEVPANGSVSGNFAPWRHLFNKPGKYRVVVYVDYYNSLPYQDFEVITPPEIPQATQASSSSGQSASTTGTATQSNPTNSTSLTPTTTPSTNTTPAKTYTVTVTSAGVYNPVNLTINAGDIINFVYSPCCGDEVITIFSPSTISSLKLDHDRTAGAVTFSSKGTWTFRAQDHNGNVGKVIVQ